MILVILSAIGFVVVPLVMLSQARQDEG
jgi:uncharacterized membrane protein